MFAATCDGCGKRYQVPRAEKAHPCKACGGTVLAAAEPSPADSGACPSCGVAVASGQAFCESCGGALKVAARAGGATGTPQRTRRSAGARAELGVARPELDRAKRAMRFVRALYIVGAALSGVALLAGGLLIGFGGEALDAFALLVLAVLAIEFTLYTFGAIRAYREPMLWSTLIAAYRTLSLLFTFVTMEEGELSGRPMIGFVMAALWTGLLWLAVVRVARVRNLIAEHPDAWDAMHALRKRGAGKDLDTASLGHRSKRVVQDRARSRRTLLIGVGAALLVGLGGWGVYALATRPPAFEPALERFTAAWNASDIDGVVGHFREEQRTSSRRWLTRGNSARDWKEGLPAIMTSHVEKVDKRRRTVRIGTADGTRVRLTWSAETGSWIVRGAAFE